VKRHDQVVAGKYGIGLLGFWSVGRRMDIRTRVRGSEVWLLHLVEDQERAEILRDRMPLESDETFTEVIVSELHDSALRMLGARRLTEYLAAELRGAILASGVSIEIFDGMARGLGPRRFAVVPGVSPASLLPCRPRSQSTGMPRFGSNSICLAASNARRLK